MWSPPAAPGDPGTLTASASLSAAFDKAAASKQWVPVLGVLVQSGNSTAPEALASFNLIAPDKVIVISATDEVLDWFEEQRASVGRDGALL